MIEKILELLMKQPIIAFFVVIAIVQAIGNALKSKRLSLNPNARKRSRMSGRRCWTARPSISQTALPVSIQFRRRR